MADIGDKLRSAREAKGLSIEDIEKATKIQSRYLTAIENDDFDKLPGDFYVRAFIRQYAQVVGLDGKKLLSEYNADIPESKPDEYVEDSIDNKSEEVKKTTDNKKNLWKNYLPRIAIGLGVIIVVLIGYVLYARLSAGGQRNNTASNNVKVSTQTSSSSSSAPKKATTTSAVKVSRLSDDEFRITGLKSNRHLVISAGNATVTSTVTINGVPKWSQTLASNQKHTIALPKNASRVVVTFSNDKDTSMKIAGKKIPYTTRNSYATLTLLIGNAKKKSSSTSHHNSSNTSTDTTTDNGTTTSSNNTTTDNNNDSSTTSSSNRTTTNENRAHQSSRTQSSSTTQSSAQTQSSTTEHHEQTQSSSQQTTQQSTESHNNTQSADNNGANQQTTQQQTNNNGK